MSIKFKTASLDPLDFIWTVFLFVIASLPTFFLALAVLNVVINSSFRYSDIIAAGIVFGVISLPIYSVILWAPLYYIISGQTVSIRRLVGDVVIPISKIQAYEIVADAPIGRKVSGLRRYVGSGGVNGMGYFGTYRLINYRAETAKVYCTRIKLVIVIRTDTEVYIISPSDPEAFCRMIRK